MPFPTALPTARSPWDLPSSRRISTCMPRPEDPGSLPRPHQTGRFPWTSCSLTHSSAANNLVFGAVPALQGVRPPLWPTGFSVYASPPLFTLLIVPLPFGRSAAGATLDTGGWLALTRRGLAPRKIRQASLGTITKQGLAAPHEGLERRRRSRASAAAPGWAKSLKYLTPELRRQAAMGFR